MKVLNYYKGIHHDHGLIFKGISKNGKYYMLDGETEISDQNYIKYSPISLLTEEEQEYLLKDYLKMREIITECKNILGK